MNRNERIICLQTIEAMTAMLLAGETGARPDEPEVEPEARGPVCPKCAGTRFEASNVMGEPDRLTCLACGHSIAGTAPAEGG